MSVPVLEGQSPTHDLPVDAQINFKQVRASFFKSANLAMQAWCPAVGAAARATAVSELPVPEWQELAKDRREWRKMSKSIEIRR
jgi:hypothetical protein